ncbi:MAG: hypothetical protein CL920_37345 [Deltaproteobacteria bacterium]|nr:hypothetical protein [Deltaproteobacteria bacterium]MBU54398.1 hypothetical protein [Deltaproteobacteria bacterium]
MTNSNTPKKQKKQKNAHRKNKPLSNKTQVDFPEGTPTTPTIPQLLSLQPLEKKGVFRRHIRDLARNLLRRTLHLCLRKLP